MQWIQGGYIARWWSLKIWKCQEGLQRKSKPRCLWQSTNFLKFKGD